MQRIMETENRHGQSVRESSLLPRRSGDEIEVRDLSVTYTSASGQEHTAVKGIDFTLAPGRFLSIVGPSGSGKSTLLMVIAGLLRATTGSALIGGVAVTEPQPDKVSVMFQDSTLLPWRTALRNVALPLEIAGITAKERMERAESALSLVGLSHFGNRFPRQLSGGMKQKVALARSLVRDPSVLLMDEPLGALDEQSRDEMGAELLRVWDRLKTTVVFITHSLSEAIFLADEVIALAGSPANIHDRFEVPFERPRSLSLMGSAEFTQLRTRLYEALRSHRTLPDESLLQSGEER